MSAIIDMAGFAADNSRAGAAASAVRLKRLRIFGYRAGASGEKPTMITASEIHLYADEYRLSEAVCPRLECAAKANAESMVIITK
jgi:hypothetical protein